MQGDGCELLLHQGQQPAVADSPKRIYLFCNCRSIR